MIELHINLKKIQQNTANLIKRLGAVEMVAVNKGCNGDLRAAQAMADGGARVIADSRLEHLKRYKKLSVKTMLLKQLTEEIDANVPDYVDYALISNLDKINRLNSAYMRRKKNLRVLLLIETGFSREGFNPEEIKPAAEIINKCSNIELKGFATNTACQNGSNPLKQLSFFTNTIRPFAHSSLLTHHSSLILSGGNSSILPWMGKLPKEINQLRIGEAILTGCDTSTYNLIKGNSTDAFSVKVDVIEDKIKKGNRQLVVDIGLQHIGAGKLWPFDAKRLKIDSKYCDYLTVLVQKKVPHNSFIMLKPDYYALSALTCSPYVKKRYVHQ